MLWLLTSTEARLRDVCSTGVPKEAWSPRSQPTHRVQEEMELQLPIPGKEPMISTFISANKNFSNTMDVIGIKMLMNVFEFIFMITSYYCLVVSM